MAIRRSQSLQLFTNTMPEPITAISESQPASLHADKRRVALRRALTVAGVLAVLAAGLVFPFPVHGRLWSNLFDLAHAIIFCSVLVCVVGSLDPPAVGLPRRLLTLVSMSVPRVLLIAVILMAVGLLGEFLQAYSGRSPSWADVAANSAGLLAGLCWVFSCSGDRPVGSILRGVALIILCWISLHPILEIVDSIQQLRSFPLLASFERPRETGSWIAHGATLARSDGWASDGRYSAMVTMHPGQYPGVAMVWFPQDWRGFRALTMDLRNPNDRPVTCFVKLYDHRHEAIGFPPGDRFERRVTIPAEAALTVEISLAEVRNAPADRAMRMDQMLGIEIFGVQVQQEWAVFLDNVRLIRTAATDRPVAEVSSQGYRNNPTLSESPE